VLYYFWNLLISDNDELMLHFFIVSYLIDFKDTITGVDHSQIPSVLSQMCLKSREDVDRIYCFALILRRNTPFSFRLMARKLEIFKPASTRLKELFAFYEPESLLSLPILPSEVFHIAYNNIISCPDSYCKNFKNIYDDECPIFCEGENQEEHYFSK
jgi:hypothetical protein